MHYAALRDELHAFYLHGDEARSKAFAENCFAALDERATDGLSTLAQKLLQYEVIAEKFTPTVFKSVPYYFETGVLTSLSDGARTAKSFGHMQANGWVYARNAHLFWEQDAKLTERRKAQGKELLYLICGPFNDDCQHFAFNNRPILEGGLKSVYERAKQALAQTDDPEKREFYDAVCRAMKIIARMAQKFASAAKDLLAAETDESARKNLALVADTAARVPWEKPETLYEALCTLAFMRKIVGSLEGIGPNTFGRLDLDLYPFYTHDLEAGILTEEQAYDLICRFLLVWDCHYDHDMKMVGYADHELENTYTLGGCDADGNPVFNELTVLFLRAAREEKIIFPKIKCRFSANSPEAYLDEIDIAVTAGTSTVLYENDDAVIPALLRAGRTLEEARDYLPAGCWDIATYEEKHDCGNYLNLLKPFEFALHRLDDKMQKVGLTFRPFDDCKTFEDFYDRTLENTDILLTERIRIGREGGNILHQVDRFPIFSSTLHDCLETGKDYTQNGAKYRDDYYYLFGFPDIVDSLLAVKTLVYDTAKYTLHDMLRAVRANWDGYEDMRLEATRCHGWGDGSEASCELAARFHRDLYALCGKKQGSYGGRVHMGYLTYTEIRFWGEKTLATPNGRRNGEYFAQGLTPSRLKKIPFVTDVIRSLAALDKTAMAANSVVNIILPDHISLDRCAAFLRAAAGTALQALQLNCTTREQLLDAQKHPENYPDLIVRVTGFSAKFVSLSPEWQNEVISRNFYR